MDVQGSDQSIAGVAGKEARKGQGQTEFSTKRVTLSHGQWDLQKNLNWMNSMINFMFQSSEFGDRVKDSVRRDELRTVSILQTGWRGSEPRCWLWQSRVHHYILKADWKLDWELGRGPLLGESGQRKVTCLFCFIVNCMVGDWRYCSLIYAKRSSSSLLLGF